MMSFGRKAAVVSGDALAQGLRAALDKMANAKL